jgi:prevent-host-death family protein
MNKIVNSLYEAKTHLSELVERAASGEEIIITKNGIPKAKLVPIPRGTKREPGGWEGKVWISPDFDDDLPDDLLDLFEKAPVEPPA